MISQGLKHDLADSFVIVIATYQTMVYNIFKIFLTMEHKTFPWHDVTMHEHANDLSGMYVILLG